MNERTPKIPASKSIVVPLELFHLELSIMGPALHFGQVVEGPL